MMRKQGIVSVSFSVGADGSLSGERVTNSSGDESLDNAALEAVKCETCWSKTSWICLFSQRTN